MVLEPGLLRESPSGIVLPPLALAPALSNMLWVNGLAAAGGNGSAVAPFQTPAEALAAVPALPDDLS